MSVYTTYSGHVIDLAFLARNSVSLEDVAHSLGFQCRFNGHTSRFYSVAEHSIVLRDLLAGESEVQNLNRRMAALLHDAVECYLGDITRPVREHLFIGASFEGTISRIVLESFGLPYTAFDDELKVMDSDLCIVEGALFIGGMYWSRAYYSLIRQKPEFVERATAILNTHNGTMWEDPKSIAEYFYKVLEEEWKSFSIQNKEEEDPNA